MTIEFGRFARLTVVLLRADRTLVELLVDEAAEAELAIHIHKPLHLHAILVILVQEPIVPIVPLHPPCPRTLLRDTGRNNINKLLLLYVIILPLIIFLENRDPIPLKDISLNRADFSGEESGDLVVVRLREQGGEFVGYFGLGEAGVLGEHEVEFLLELDKLR